MIGAGPGDIKLITFKGLECIKKADVIVYDRLANSRLCPARADAKLIYVSKSRATPSQDEINQVLVEEASRTYSSRLKVEIPSFLGRWRRSGSFIKCWNTL